ncbi:hypothetical protein LTR37_010143 [Vermiconidia calcicola]|uniref:Uncharacterized protein n=1 Tax=Vermiconidia calcicola TaxID=1690605 RepID=A0ACC3N5R8_9PEZI|nr:hypothetical protein LTR37_010143 [Vermiconidia calcicola]
MNYNQTKPSGQVLANKPSSSFSTFSSAASATSAATSRSGGSRLLFGEIDTSSDRSSELYASVCSFVLCESSTFLKFWLEDKCRETFLSCVPKRDLASLRLACHDFSVRAAPALFNDLSITFHSSTFTRPARLAALDRLGFYVKTLRFNFPHSAEMFLPPLVDPESGAELSFTYTPQIEAPTPRRPKYGDIGTTEILTRQWPTLFHAATNVPAFIRALSAFVNLSHLKISCPGYDCTQGYRRNTVDFALISLRIAVERNSLNALDSLTLSPIHPSGLLYLSPLLGHGATPRSASRWSRIQHLTIHANTIPSAAAVEGDPDYYKLLQTYVRNFQNNLTTFKFRWVGEKGPIPTQRVLMSANLPGEHSATEAAPNRSTPRRRRRELPALHFPRLQHVDLENMKATAADISTFVEAHKRTIEELNLESIELTDGDWDDALAPLTKRARARPSMDIADFPIMLSPTTLPAPMERIEVAPREANCRKSLRTSKWLSTKKKGRPPSAAQKVREGLLGCETQLRKVLRGSVFPWRSAQS